ncbi:bifunctional enoyl-CoA hydratase/phosphate acetyltransferase [Tropicimonas marinistellae]|uniref:bifunctional enoyl-CoA hydratase/phosphate acetyltransferase n=1 Tax=Tropicimonas marinistellae TaxID=1739787 RepID=UPI00082A5789|nr:bifunctional enoyl-CoA hydratase/phosphate acetyltransferase [Tropicimonas marinistellae]
MTDQTHMENRTYDELKVGDTASLTRIAREEDFLIFATASGNHNPMHLAKYDGDGDGSPEAVAPSLWVGSLVSAVLGNLLPGAGTLYRSQTFSFSDRAEAGDELVVTVKVVEKLAGNGVRLATEVRRSGDDRLIVSGEAEVTAPVRKLTFDALEIPGLLVQRHRHFDRIIAQAGPLDPLVTAVVVPEEPNSLGGALLAMEESIITPILIGAPDKIAAAAAEIGRGLDGIEIIEEPDHAAAAMCGVDLVADGRAGAIMKGHLHTDDLLRAALRKERGLRAGRRFTHVFVMDVPGVPHPLLVTDAAINIEPDLKTKVDIVQNGIDVAISIGIETPKVGVLSAVETVNPDIPSSVDAALLAKMADRGQITGGLVDGPLAMDNAVDLGAARTKGITSEVAGRAEVLVVPNLDAGNMLAKQLAYISHAEGAGLVLGAKVPIILNSRSDDDMARLASCAVAALHHNRTRA